VELGGNIDEFIVCKCLDKFQDVRAVAMGNLVHDIDLLEYLSVSGIH